MRYRLGLLVCMLVAVSSCKKINDFTAFNLSYTAHFSIPGTIATNQPVDIYTPDVQTNADSIFALYHTAADHIDDVILNQLKLTITSPSTGDFSFLSSIVVCISAGNLPEVRLASKTNIPDNVGNTLELLPNNVNLREYFAQSSFKLHLIVTTDKTILEEYQIDALSVLRVHAKVI